MKGLEISKRYYNEFGKQMLQEQFPDIADKIAVGLVGSGSECFGYDDSISTDHDFDPGFLIFISDDINDDIKFKLERAYSKLPREYNGFTRATMSPVGGNRRGVKRVSDFLNEKTGTPDGKLSIYDWINIPEESLAEVVNGEIWKDDSGIMKKVRLRLATFPEDIKLKKIAGELLTMAQSGQYNFLRCIAHNEFGASKLAIYEYVKATMHVVFLLNEVYMPFYKWDFRALRDLSWPKDLSLNNHIQNTCKTETDGCVEESFENKLINLLSVSDDKSSIERIKGDIELISRLFIDRLASDGLIDKTLEKDVTYLEKYAYQVNNKIKNIEIRNMNILVAV